MAGFSIDVRSNLAGLSARLEQYQRREIPFATVYALTKTAQDIRDAEYRAMNQAFDRPTRFTLNSLLVEPATRQSPIASVRFKEGFGSVPAWRYLGPEIEGGPRVKKSHELALQRAGILKEDEYAVPGAGASIDAYGNMRGSQITQILSQVRAGDASQFSSNSRRSRVSKARAGTFFVMRGQRAPDGIYRRQGRNLTPVMIFVRQPKYRARLPFSQTAEQVFSTRFDIRFQEGVYRFGVLAPIPKAA